MKILSIETSCDETAVSIIEASGDLHQPKFLILGNALHSQIATHAEYGGVFPALAKREHTLNLIPMFKLANQVAFEKNSELGLQNESILINLSEEKKIYIQEILSRENNLGPALLEFIDTNEIFNVDAIAVTQGPGLEPALWVGISFAKALAIALDKPIIPVNHMEGHIVSVLTETSNGEPHQSSLQFPALALLISGGHTELVLSKDWHTYEIIGQTVDDAVGEAFDKVARIMGLPYPGGPKISKLAAESREEGLCEKYKAVENLSFDEAKDTEMGTGTGKNLAPWTLPRPMLKSPDFNFSFSGLKTAVLYAVRDKLKDRAIEMTVDHADTGETVVQNSETVAAQLTDIEIKTLAEEFENAVTDVLVYKTKRAIEETNAQSLIIGGGVIANTYIRQAFKKVTEQTGVQLFTPSISLSTDNSVMIGIAGYLRWIAKDTGILMPKDLHYEDGAFNIEKLAGFKANGNLSL